VDVTARVYDYATRIEEPEIILEPGDFVLGETAEAMSLDDNLCALIEGKSGRARHGLIVLAPLRISRPDGGWGRRRLRMGQRFLFQNGSRLR
jgi:deoxycytidine triphosphate deaminase